MARRRERNSDFENLGEMPEYLSLPRLGKRVYPWFDENEFPPATWSDLAERDLEFWRWWQSRKRCKAARIEYLAKLDQRPRGASTAEFLTAHGYKFSEQEKARKKGLIF